LTAGGLGVKLGGNPANRFMNPAHLVRTARNCLGILMLGASAQAQINIQDGNPLFITYASGSSLSQPFTVTAGAGVLVVMLEDRNTVNLGEPATLAWNGQTLTRDIQTAYTTGNIRSLAIYHLFNPAAGTSNITGTLTGTASDTWVTAYTLNGVDATVAPITGSVNTGGSTDGVTNLSISLGGVADGSWAAISSQFANFATVTVTGTGGTGITVTDNTDATTAATAGYVTGLSAGSVTISNIFVPSNGSPQKANFAVAIFAPPPPPPVGTPNAFGIKFLGNTTSLVTNLAGVVPIIGWNNITNTTFTSGTIYSSDGAASATLALTGGGRGNGWNSGTGADGRDGSLMRGYCDAMANGPVSVTISGLTGSSYTIFIYTQGDVQRPSGGSDWMPNYTINGSTIYIPTMAPSFSRYVQGGMTLVNTNAYPTGLANNNYIRWNNGIPNNGVITISANTDGHSYRSPLNGIELVLNTNQPPSQTRPIRIMPLGDSITWGYPNAPVTGGYRLSLYQLLTNANIPMDFVGTQVSPAPGLFYPNHEGHSGYRIDQIDDPYFLSWVNTVASPDVILLLIGTNDIGQDYDPTNAIVRLDALISHITTDRPNARVIVANLLARSDATDNNMINTLFNPFVPGVVAQHVANGEQVYFWDLHAALTVADTDGLHPIPSGYIKIGNQWFNAINNVYGPYTGFNLAFNKIATASSVNGNNVPTNAVDGNASTYWSSVNSDPQWLSVDLGTVQNISRVRWVWTAAYGKSYQIQISTNNATWVSVYNTTGGVGGTNSVSFAPASARYVRIYGTARANGLGYGIYEFQVCATPLADLALNKPVTASSTSDAVNFPASKTVDGDPDTGWSSRANDAEWIAVDLGSVQSIGWVRLKWGAAYGQGYEIQVSTNNLSWSRVYNTASGTGGIEDISFTAANARYVRMYGMQRGTTNGYFLNEFCIYGSPNTPASTQFQPLAYVPGVKAAANQSNSSLALSWNSLAQQPYGIQFTTNLMAPVWYDYEPQVTATGNVANLLLPLYDGPQKFFRVKPAF
jgi:lysophospholipase L1-like esterase